MMKRPSELISESRKKILEFWKAESRAWKPGSDPLPDMPVSALAELPDDDYHAFLGTGDTDGAYDQVYDWISERMPEQEIPAFGAPPPRPPEYGLVTFEELLDFCGKHFPETEATTSLWKKRCETGEIVFSYLGLLDKVRWAQRDLEKINAELNSSDISTPATLDRADRNVNAATKDRLEKTIADLIPKADAVGARLKPKLTNMTLALLQKRHYSDEFGGRPWPGALKEYKLLPSELDQFEAALEPCGWRKRGRDEDGESPVYPSGVDEVYDFKDWHVVISGRNWSLCTNGHDSYEEPEVLESGNGAGTLLGCLKKNDMCQVDYSKFHESRKRRKR